MDLKELHEEIDLENFIYQMKLRNNHKSMSIDTNDLL